MSITSTGFETQLLAALLQSREFIRFDHLDAQLEAGVQLADQLQVLESLGSELQTHPQHGVKLLKSGLGCWCDYIEANCADGIGKHAVVYQQTGSTQDVANRLAGDIQSKAGQYHGYAVIAREQTAGRGRRGNAWHAAMDASLTLSCIINAENHTVDRLSITGCLAIMQAIKKLTGAAAQIKWPNDLMVEGKKLCGILVEKVNGYAVIGIGLNLSKPEDLPAEVAKRATAMDELASPLDPLYWLVEILKQLSLTLSMSEENLVDLWREASWLLQKKVCIESAGRTWEGRVVDLHPSDGLLLALERGQVITIPCETAHLRSIDGVDELS